MLCFGEVGANLKVRGGTREFFSDHWIGCDNGDFVAFIGEIPCRAGTAPVAALVEQDDGLAEFGLIAQHFFAGEDLAIFKSGQLLGFG